MEQSHTTQLVLALALAIMVVDIGSASASAATTMSVPGPRVMRANSFPVRYPMAISLQPSISVGHRPWSTTSLRSGIGYRLPRTMCRMMLPSDFVGGVVVSDPTPSFFIDVLIKAIYVLAAPAKSFNETDADAGVNEGSLNFEYGFQDLLADPNWRRAAEMYGDGFVTVMVGSAFHHHNGALKAKVMEVTEKLVHIRDDDALRKGGRALVSSIDRIGYCLRGYSRDHEADDNTALQHLQAALFQEMDRISLCHVDNDQMRRLAQHCPEQHRLLLAIYAMIYYDKTQDKP